MPRGKQIISVDQVIRLAQEGRAVVVQGVGYSPIGPSDRRVPAAFLANYQASYLFRFLMRNKCYEWIRESPKKGDNNGDG